MIVIIFACGASIEKFVKFRGVNMGKIIEKYIIVADGEIIKSYKTFKEAMWDMDFFQLMYHEVCIYQQVVKNGETV